MENTKKLMTRKRVLSFVLFMLPVALILLWLFNIPSEPLWAIRSLRISWQLLAGIAMFVAIVAWGLLDKKGVWDEK